MQMTETQGVDMCGLSAYPVVLAILAPDQERFRQMAVRKTPK